MKGEKQKILRNILSRRIFNYGVGLLLQSHCIAHGKEQICLVG